MPHPCRTRAAAPTRRRAGSAPTRRPRRGGSGRTRRARRAAPRPRRRRTSTRRTTASGARRHRHVRAVLDRERQDEPVVVVGVLADEVDAAGGRPGVGGGHSLISGIDSTACAQARGRGLGWDVADPGAHGGLGSGEELELVRRAARRRELQVQAHRVAAAPHGRLMPGGDVRRRGVVERVDAAQQSQVERGELVALRVGRLGEVGDVAVRQQVHLERPARGERHERGPVLALQDDALGRALELEDAREQVGSLAVDRGEQARRARA